LVLPVEAQRFGAIVGFDNGVFVVAQKLPNNVPNSALVINQQDALPETRLRFSFHIVAL
jgi:hypothetical protein